MVDIINPQHMMIIVNEPFLLGIKFKNSKKDFVIQEDLNTSVTSLLDISTLNVLHQSCSDEMIEATIDVPLYNESSNDVDEYAIYSRIEEHMAISLSLFQVNRQGQSIVKELCVNKLKMSPSSINNLKIKKTLNNSVTIKLYQNLTEIVNFNRTNTDIYTDLINSLDDAMFDESQCIDSFYVDDTEYKLEALYYRQETWIEKMEWYEQDQYKFDESDVLDLGECSHILLFLNRYRDALTAIHHSMNAYEKVIMYVDKLSKKIVGMIDNMYELVHLHLCDGVKY